MPPSNKDPNIIQAGPGKLPAGSVPASAISFPIGGGGAGDLALHIADPVDAHMASAIGVNALDAFGNPILSSSGGVVDGESVLDFIVQFKDLIPPHPNFLGLNLPAGVNSGIPDWGQLNALGIGTGTAVTGGYAIGAVTTPSHFLVPVLGAPTFTLGGMVFPADRGVLALYKNTDGNFFNGGATTLVAALSLNDVAPAGIPNAAFSEAARLVNQANYVATNAGIDFISLTYRLPYLKSYVPYPGAPYAAYDTNFYQFQLATFAVPAQALAAGGSQNWLLVHWKETYATTLASIQPAQLTVGNLVASKCYSAVPAASNFDDNTAAIYNVNRHHVFRDILSATSPTVNAFTTANANAPATVQYSGVTFTNQTTLQFNVTLSANDLFDNSFVTGSLTNPPDVPLQFASANDPIVVHFTDFGGGSQLVPYDSLRKQGIPGNYSIANAPQLADIGEYINTTLPIVTPAAAFTPNNALGYGVLSADFHKPFVSSTGHLDASKKYLYNTFPATGGVAGSSTSIFDGFVDELHRYVSLHAPIATDRIVPVGGNIYVSATALTVDTDSLQIVANNLVYPQVDFSACFPVGPNYSTIPGIDAVNHPRRHTRVFDTGIPRNTGTLRIRFLGGFGTSAAFTQNAAYNGTETTGHITGGMIIQVKVPGVTGWLDIGRPLGDPGLATTDFYGCSTGVTISGSDILVTFNTTAFTANNTSGEFPLFVRVTMLNSAAGRALRLDELAWSP